jgi:hypothetical protein
MDSLVLLMGTTPTLLCVMDLFKLQDLDMARVICVYDGIEHALTTLFAGFCRVKPTL